jgi:hypothetical protein
VLIKSYGNACANKELTTVPPIVDVYDEIKLLLSVAVKDDIPIGTVEKYLYGTQFP